MQFRCHECGELFESTHTNYKFAKGFHPSANPTMDADKARELDHCENCQRSRSYDPVSARTADLANSSLGPSSSVITELMGQVETLKAQVQAKEAQEATIASLKGMVESLSARLAPPAAAPATT